MRRLSASIAVLGLILAACGGGAPTTTQQTSSNPPQSNPPGQTSGTVGSQPPASQGGGGTTSLPAGCATAFVAYLKLIEPAAAELDAATATLNDFEAVDEAVQEKGIEAMDNPATLYDCSSIGLEFAYFDSSSPWDVVLQVAGAEAPGTVAWFTALREKRASDDRTMADYGASSCDDAVAKIKQGVKDAGVDDVGAMQLGAALALLGLYDTYLHEVQDEACPRDALGNDEFDFFGAF